MSLDSNYTARIIAILEQHAAFRLNQPSLKGIWQARLVKIAEFQRPPIFTKEGRSYQPYILLVWEVFGGGPDLYGCHRLAYGLYPLSMNPRSRVCRLFQRWLGIAPPTSFAQKKGCLGQYGLIEVADDGEEPRVLKVLPDPNGPVRQQATDTESGWDCYKFPLPIWKIVSAKKLSLTTLDYVSRSGAGGSE